MLNTKKLRISYKKNIKKNKNKYWRNIPTYTYSIKNNKFLF